MDKGSNIFMRMQLCEKVKLEPAFITKSYRDEVMKRLKAKVEGICSRHGFIKADSIEILKICTGRVEMIGLNGNTTYDVYFWADVCNPLLGSVIRCRVSNINKFGILAEAGGIIEAIVAKNSVNITSEVDLDKIRIGDEVVLEVVGKKYELNEKKISLIGKIVKNNDAVKSIQNSDKNTKRIILEDEDDEQIEIPLEDDASDKSDVSDEDDNSDVVSESDDDLSSEEEDDILSVKKKSGDFFSDDEGYFNSDDENNDDDFDVEDDAIEETDE